MDIEDIVEFRYLTDAEFAAEISSCLNCEEKPCKTACPCDCSPFDFILATKLDDGNVARAAGEIMSKNPLGGVCGVVCPDRFCVNACVRKDLDKPVDIPAVQAYIMRKARDKNLFFGVWNKDVQKRSHKSCAIVGGGPSGLSCAAVLGRKGFSVTILEQRETLGGSLYSIPTSRLPRKMIEEDASFITSQGDIRVELNTKVDDLAVLQEKFDAVCVCTGLSNARTLDIEGEDCCIQAMDFLWNRFAKTNDVKNKNIAIVGGGPVAVDVARVCREQGASAVSLIYRRREKDMNITQKERDCLLQLGADVLSKMVVDHVEGDAMNKTVSKVFVKRCRLDGRKIKTSESTLLFDEFDKVILSIGNVPQKLEQNSKKRNVLFVGDYINGASTVVEASAFGKEAAKAISKFLDEGSSLQDIGRVRKSNVVLKGYIEQPVDLKVEFFGLTLENPFLLSASPLTDNLDMCKKALRCGWAGLILKTAFSQQYIHVPGEYMAKMNEQTYGNCDNVSALPLETQCETLKLLMKEFPEKLIITSTGGSLTGNDETDCASWVKNTKMIEDSGGRVIEYSLSCPQGGEGSEEGAICSQSESMTMKVIGWVLKHTNPKVAKMFKLTAAVSSMSRIAISVKKVFDEYPKALAGITLANSFPSLEMKEKEDVEHGKWWKEGRIVGMAGSGVLPITKNALASVEPYHLIVSGNGGVFSANDAVDLLSLNCKTLQLCTAPSILGVSYVRHLTSSLSHLLKNKGFSSIQELQKHCSAVPTVTEFMDLSHEKKIPFVDKNACISCGNCTRCPYNAIEMDIEDMVPKINPALCVGCSMCVLKCPSKALFMRKRTDQERKLHVKHQKSLGIVMPN